MDTTGIAANRTEGLSTITTPTAQRETLRTQLHMNTTGLSTNAFDTLATSLGKRELTVRAAPSSNVLRPGRAV